MKKILLLLVLAIIITGCESYTSSNQSDFNSDYQAQEEKVSSNYVDIKYRDDDVDIASFEKLNTSGSSLVKGAWYDNSNEYMVINLSGIYYHYCSMPSSVWYQFKKANSFGSDYNSYVKGNYDCRYNYMPNY